MAGFNMVVFIAATALFLSQGWKTLGLVLLVLGVKFLLNSSGSDERKETNYK